MTTHNEALKMAIEGMVKAEKVFDDIGLLLIKFGVNPSDINFHKESFLAPAIQACKESLERPSNMVVVPLDKLQDMQRRLKPLAQPQSVKDALEEAARICDGITKYTQYQSLVCYEVANLLAVKIRALIEKE